jgi:serine protease Do
MCGPRAVDTVSAFRFPEAIAMSESASPLAALSDHLAALAATTARCTVAIDTGPRHAGASGVLWRPGLVVTTAHAFRRLPDQIALRAEGGAELCATAAGADPSTDLAVFRIAEGSPQPAPAAIGDAAGVRTGHVVLAVGRSSSGHAMASYGMVLSAGGPWQSWLGGSLDHAIRLDGGLHEGMPGGPVVDAHGMVIGIGSMALSRSQAMVVPAATVSRVVDALLANGHVARAYLGIAAQPVALAGEAGGDEATGLLITSLAKGGPAEAGGIIVGDILREADGCRAGSLRELRQALASRVGESVKLSVLRGGQPAELSITVGQWPQRASRC